MPKERDDRWDRICKRVERDFSSVHLITLALASERSTVSQVPFLF